MSYYHIVTSDSTIKIFSRVADAANEAETLLIMGKGLYGTITLRTVILETEQVERIKATTSKLIIEGIINE